MKFRLSFALAPLFLLAGLDLSPAVAAPAPVDVQVSSAALRAHVDALCGITFRRTANPQGMKRAVAYIRNAFAANGLATTTQHFAFGRGSGESENVIATLNPKRPEIIVVGAHYDVAGDQPGADDNASGVAALLELGRALAADKDRIPCQVQLVAFANEEAPFFGTPGMGSFNHALLLKGFQKKVRLMISLDMVGYFTETEGSQAYPMRFIGWLRPKKGNFISLVSSLGRGFILHDMRKAFERVTSLPVETLVAPRFVKGVDASDHMNYWRFGFPAMMITDTASFRNPNYHKPTDTPDTLDYTKMAEVVKGLTAYLTSL